MHYRVEELASASGMSVDTVRFYQGRGLIPGPRRDGRVALYGDEHLGRIRQIRALLDQGFTLAQIRRMPGPGELESGEPEPLLAALVEESGTELAFSRAEFAAQAGVPQALLVAAERAGLFEPVKIDGEDRFTQADLEMAQAGLSILGAGFPIHELLTLAVEHADGIRRVSDTAIDLFDNHIRKAETSDGGETAEAFRTLLPQVTQLVAQHFHRTLVNRALERLRASGDDAALERTLEVTRSARLDVKWR